MTTVNIFTQLTELGFNPGILLFLLISVILLCEVLYIQNPWFLSLAIILALSLIGLGGDNSITPTPTPAAGEATPTPTIGPSVAGKGWAKSAGGSGDDQGNAIAALADGSCLVAGVFSDNATFGEGANETTLASGGLFLAKYTANGTLGWVKHFASGTSWDSVNSISAFSDGSCVITGCFVDNATFGEGSNTAALTADSSVRTIFVAKFYADGTLAWAKQANSIYAQEGMGIAAYSDGSCVITGWFSDNATFGQTTLTSAGDTDIFIAKYDSSGSVVWAKRAGGTSADASNAVCALADGSCIVTGSYSGTATFGAGAGHVSFNTEGIRTIFTAKYNPSGELVWAKEVGGTIHADNEGLGISAFPDGSCVVTGSFMDNVTFGEGSEALTFVVDRQLNYFVVKYNSDGSFAWVRQAAEEEFDFNEGTGISAMADGTCIVTGYFNGDFAIGNAAFNVSFIALGQGSDIFIAKLGSNGNMIWAKGIGGMSPDMGLAVATLADGSSFITGAFSGATFGEGTNQVNLPTNGSTDTFIAKYNPNGTLAP